MADVLTKIWSRLFGVDEVEEVRADEQVVSRELQASAPAPELEKLAAARNAKLLHLHGAFIGSKNDFDVPGTLVPGLEMIGLTLEFAERQPLFLKGHGHGEGLTPCEARDIYWEDSAILETRDLDELEPFAGVVGTRFRELTLLSYRGHDCHVGIRMQFEGAELVLLNLWDEIEAYNGLSPEVLQPQIQPDRVYVQLYEYPFEGA